MDCYEQIARGKSAPSDSRAFAQYLIAGRELIAKAVEIETALRAMTAVSPDQSLAAMDKRSLNPIDVEIGKRLRMLRVKRDLSQAALGKKLGIAYKQLHKYENGTGRISAGRLVELANLLDVSPSLFFENELFEDEPCPKPDGKETPELPTDKDRLAVARAFDRIRSPSVRRTVAGLIAQLADSL